MPIFFVACNNYTFLIMIYDSMLTMYTCTCSYRIYIANSCPRAPRL